MRGVAVVVMVMGHSIDAVLSRAVRTSGLFQLYDAGRGFTGPMFLFVAGFAFIVATEKRWAEFHAFGTPVLKRLSRFIGLWGIGYALHFPFFSFDKLLHNTTSAEYAQMFQADVLHCLVLSMILLQLMLFVVKTPRAFAWLVFGLGGAVVLATPLTWQVNFSASLSPVLAPYLNGLVPSIFPVFPYAGFIFSGVVVGHFYLDALQHAREQEFLQRLMVVGYLVVVAGLIADLLPWQIYPAHDFWKASPSLFLIRFGIIALVTVAFASLRQIPSSVSRSLITLGQASLLIYVTHLVFVYGSPANEGLMQKIGQVLPSHQALAVAGAVMVGMLLFVHAWNYVRSYHVPVLRFAQAIAASTLLFYFFTKPW
jgi:hypothetical protein